MANPNIALAVPFFMGPSGPTEYFVSSRRARLIDLFFLSQQWGLPASARLYAYRTQFGFTNVSGRIIPEDVCDGYVAQGNLGDSSGGNTQTPPRLVFTQLGSSRTIEIRLTFNVFNFAGGRVTSPDFTPKFISSGSVRVDGYEYDRSTRRSSPTYSSTVAFSDSRFTSRIRTLSRGIAGQYYQYSIRFDDSDSRTLDTTSSMEFEMYFIV